MTGFKLLIQLKQKIKHDCPGPRFSRRANQAHTSLIATPVGDSTGDIVGCSEWLHRTLIYIQPRKRHNTTHHSVKTSFNLIALVVNSAGAKEAHKGHLHSIWRRLINMYTIASVMIQNLSYALLCSILNMVVIIVLVKELVPKELIQKIMEDSKASSIYSGLLAIGVAISTGLVIAISCT